MTTALSVAEQRLRSRHRRLRRCRAARPGPRRRRGLSVQPRVQEKDLFSAIKPWLLLGLLLGHLLGLLLGLPEPLDDLCWELFWEVLLDD